MKNKLGKITEKNLGIFLIGIFIMIGSIIFITSLGGGPTAGIWMDLSANDTGDWVGTDNINGVAVNTNDNLVYTILGVGKFGVYNHSNGIWMNLSGNDTGGWATSETKDVAVNTNDNLVYTALNSGKFGVYNHSNGIWMDLSANDTGNWAGTTNVEAIAVNPNDNLVYTAFGNIAGKFGVYNHSNGIWMNLSGNDTGGWANLQDIMDVAVNPNDNLVYTALSSGKFGVYNHSNGVWMDLSANDTGNWASNNRVQTVAVNTNDNLVYTGLFGGKFGVYNHSNGIWMDLSANDTGDWVGTTTVFEVAVNTNDNLVYTALNSGKFGVYNHSSGIWRDLSDSDTGNWVGTSDVYSVAVNTNDSLVYNGIQTGKFGVYNYSSVGGGGDTTPPNVTILNSFPANGSTYSSSQRYNFNATVVDGVAVDSVLFEWNGLTNYTPVNTTADPTIFNITLPLSLNAGVYSYKWIVNDTSNNLNATETRAYTISKASHNPTLYLNSTEPNQLNLTYPSQVNVSYNISNSEQSFSLLRDGTEITGFNGIFQNIPSAFYNFTVNTSETQNYSATSISRFLNLTKGSIIPTLYLNSTETNQLNITYPSQVNASYNTSIAEQTLTLLRNGTLITGANNIFQDLQVAFYNFTVNSSESQNYSATSISRFLNLTKGTPNVTAIINTTYLNMTIEIGESINVNGTLNTGSGAMNDANLNLTLDSVQLNFTSTLNRTNFNVRFNTNKSNYNVTVRYSGNENWTELSNSRYVNVENLDVILGPETLLNSTISNGTLTFNSITVYSPEVIMGTNFIRIINASWTNGDLIFNVSTLTQLNYTNANFTFDTNALPYLINSTNSQKNVGNNFTHNINGTLDVSISTNACSPNSIEDITVNNLEVGYSRIYEVDNSSETTCFASGRLRLINVFISNSSFTNVLINYAGGGGAPPGGPSGGGEPEPELPPEIVTPPSFPTEDIPVIITPQDPRWKMQTDEGGGFYEFNMPKKTTRTKNLVFINLKPESVILNISCEKEFCQYVELAEEHFTLPLNTEIESKVGFTVTLPKNIQNGTYYADLVATDQYGNRGIIPLKVNMDSKLSFIPYIINKLGSKKIIIKGVPGIPIWLLTILVAILSFFAGKFLIFFKNKEARDGLAVIFAMVISIIFLRII